MARGSPVDAQAFIPAWQPWVALAGFSLALHFAWEMAQMSLYVTRATPDWRIVARCAQATLGDVVITLAAYATVAVSIRSRLWLRAPRWTALAVYIGFGLAATVVLEWWNVYVRHTWTYVPSMPTVAGIGAVPLLQWAVLPALVLVLARKRLWPRTI